MTSTSIDSIAPCPPSTADFLEFHATQSPNKAAIDWNHQTHTYGQLHRDLIRVTHALYELGLRPGQLALVHQLNPYFHILLLLACENLRVTTGTLPTLRATVLLNRADVLLSGVQAPDVHRQVHLVDDQWFASALTASPHQNISNLIAPREMSDILRVTRSSGTTGQPKVIRLNRIQFEYSIQGTTRNKKISHQSVFLVGYGCDIFSIWSQITAVLREGGTAAWGTVTEISQKFRLTHLWLLPVDLGNAFQNLPKDYQKSPGLKIYTGGAPVSAELRKKARALLCDDVINGYGTNEVGPICKLDSNNCGVLLPGIELKIVDDNGNSLPLGAEGNIALRSPGMVHSYWDQVDYTAKYFRDGWFFPGDRGKLMSPRVLQHLGRNDEVINFGGVKYATDFIEKFFLKFPSVLDVAATSAKRSDDVEILIVAVVMKDLSDLPKIKLEAKSQFLSLAEQMQIFSCAQIPRTATGKIQRMALKDMLAQLA